MHRRLYSLVAASHENIIQRYTHIHRYFTKAYWPPAGIRVIWHLLESWSASLLYRWVAGLFLEGTVLRYWHFSRYTKLNQFFSMRPRSVQNFNILKGQCHEIFDFWFFYDSVSPQPQNIPMERFEFFRKFAEIFASQGAPPVSTTPVLLV